MSNNVKICAFVKTWAVGSTVEDIYTTDYTQEEWDKLTEEARHGILEDYRKAQEENFYESGAYVLE